MKQSILLVALLALAACNNTQTSNTPAEQSAPAAIEQPVVAPAEQSPAMEAQSPATVMEEQSAAETQPTEKAPE